MIVELYRTGALSPLLELIENESQAALMKMAVCPEAMLPVFRAEWQMAQTIKKKLSTED